MKGVAWHFFLFFCFVFFVFCYFLFCYFYFENAVAPGAETRDLARLNSRRRPTRWSFTNVKLTKEGRSQNERASESESERVRVRE